jgi:hypothetical protein
VITLTHVDDTRLYQAEHSTDPGFLTYYVSDQEVEKKDLPPTLDVDTEWWSKSTLRGYFLILPNEPADIRAFAAVAEAYPFGVPGHASFAWVQYQENPAKINNVYKLDLNQDEGGEVLITTAAMFRFGGYGLPFMPNGVVRTLSAQDKGIYQLSFGYPLQYPDGRPPHLPPDIPQPDGTGVNLPLLGPQRYVLQSLSLVGDFSNDSGQGMDVGLRYSYAQDGKVVSQFYPIFAPSSGLQVEFLVNWDPLAPLNPQRSWMKFTGNSYTVTVTDEGQGKIEVAPDGNVLATWLRTIYGKPLWLRPVLTGDHAARLVMQPRPPDKPGEQAFYMVPDGDYEVLRQSKDSAENPSMTPFNLLCGLAGTESIAFPPGTFAAPETMIRFHAWKPAFAPVFPLTDAASGIEKSGAHRFKAVADTPLLDDTWPTAWISVAPSREGIEAVYYSQPEQAALYDPKTSVPGSNMLALYQAPVARFQNAALANSYPLAIYAGLAGSEVRGGFPPGRVRDFEMQILNRFRKEKISEIPKLLPLTPELDLDFTTTPQGLIAKIRGLKWESVLLAQNLEDGSKLEFVNLGDNLREALQSNQMFLVVSLPAPLGDFKHKITIAGWPFDINVGSGGDDDFRNILIFKFGRGAIKDLVTDPKAWTNPTTFNKDPGRMSLFLQSYIANAETSAQDNHRFKKFVNLVSNPAWEGILALRVTVGLNQFPADLKGLLAGINLSRFEAHHFGIETSFVKSASGELKQDKSSLFGLISYVDKDFISRKTSQAVHSEDRLITHVPQVVPAIDPASNTYNFKVLQLEVVFENSELLDFTSKIQLTTTTWFGEPASLQSGYPPDPIDNQSIVLNGSYEVHNGQRSYSFYTDPNQTYKFLISSHVLNYVQIVKARFETLRSEPSGQDENIFTRFSFWGCLNFKQLAGLDLFSFGSLKTPQQSEKQGLYFSNLGITMDFTLLANGTTGSQVFAFDAGLASYDISQSEVRANSLFNRFPLKVTSIMQSDGRGGLADLGFLPVRTPKEFRALRLTKDWYALNFELNLGSMGALAARAGFSAALLVAWSPAEGIARAETQIKLPGTGGGKKLLSLQGVLKLSIQYFEFKVKPLGQTGDLQYQLLFKNAGLSVIGKKLPTSGTIDMILFGDPLRQLEPGSLAWTAAYMADKKPKLLNAKGVR